jgi:two-component system response regulator HupR/HoxA
LAPLKHPAEAHRAEVLIVEDEKALRDVYEAALALWFTPVLAATAAEADALLANREFKVVVSDHLMPGESGVSFLKRMRLARPRMQRILVTGFMHRDECDRMVREAGLMRLLSKPAPMAVLANAVREALALHATGT